MANIIKLMAYHILINHSAVRTRDIPLSLLFTPKVQINSWCRRQMAPRSRRSVIKINIRDANTRLWGREGFSDSCLYNVMVDF